MISDLIVALSAGLLGIVFIWFVIQLGLFLT